MNFRLVFVFACSIAALHLPTRPAAAQNTSNPWTGEGSISAAYTSGNTESTDVGIALKAAKQIRALQIKGQVEVDYGENSGVESRNRWALAGQFNRTLSNSWFVYGRGTYEQDKFSGFESRSFFGLGLGYKLFNSERTKWTLEAGPGYRHDVIQLTQEAKNEVGARLGSSFAYEFNSFVSLSNETEWVYSQVSTQLTNMAAINAKLTDKFATRLSFEVRNESKPQPGNVATDTITRFSLVYGF